MNNHVLKSRFLYKLTSIVIKYLPFVLMFIQIILLILNFMGIVVPVLSLVGGTSLLFIFVLYLLSYLFQYCSLYRMPLWYNLTIGVIATLKSIGLITLDTLGIYRLIAFITGGFLLILIYFIYKYRNHSKLGGIKQFCDKYLDCKF